MVISIQFLQSPNDDVVIIEVPTSFNADDAEYRSHLLTKTIESIYARPRPNLSTVLNKLKS